MFFYWLIAVVVAVDQATKILALQKLSPDISVSVIPRVLDFTLVMNRGVAFGLFSQHRVILLGVITLSLIVLAVLLFYLRKKNPSKTRSLDLWAFSLILGGAIGNWIDRLRFSAVVDFIDFRVWPVFNVADIAISVGVGLYFIYAFKRKDI